eukprot:TRINITY_DN31047_c0_g1_i1.p3 TRINITY_DN31047_c0_g1~~TRINITY_DN31047_c0_g1_i1.p3  ORF type:complete len:130 (-),score=26.61 TRINITY_DN31047_c0_g1_i1:144-533(-)
MLRSRVGSEMCIRDRSCADLEELGLELLRLLGRRGILSLLGYRQTLGSTLRIFPPRHVLVHAFSVPHVQGGPLSVGARALAKHAGRHEEDGWWGVVTGSDANKNQLASRKLEELLGGGSLVECAQHAAA